MTRYVGTVGGEDYYELYGIELRGEHLDDLEEVLWAQVHRYEGSANKHYQAWQALLDDDGNDKPGYDSSHERDAYYRCSRIADSLSRVYDQLFD